MINLIPKEEKKRMTTDFYLRLSVVFMLMLSSSVFIACSAMLPAYFLSLTKDSIANSKLEGQKADPASSSRSQSLSEIKDLNSKLKLVEDAEKNKFQISEKVIQAILLKKSSDIKITQISYEDNGTQGKKISLLGVAPSREALLQFQQALEDDPAFNNVDLPISNFVKDSDIQFNLSLNPVN